MGHCIRFAKHQATADFKKWPLMQKIEHFFSNLGLAKLSFDYFDSHLIKFMKEFSLVGNLVEVGSLNCMSADVSFFVFYSLTREFNHGVMNCISTHHIHDFMVFFVCTHRFFPLGSIVKQISHLKHRSFMSSTRPWDVFAFNLQHLSILEAGGISQFTLWDLRGDGDMTHVRDGGESFTSKTK